jgi:hypothetical protein
LLRRRRRGGCTASVAPRVNPSPPPPSPLVFPAPPSPGRPFPRTSGLAPPSPGGSRAAVLSPFARVPLAFSTLRPRGERGRRAHPDPEPRTAHNQPATDRRDRGQEGETAAAETANGGAVADQPAIGEGAADRGAGGLTAHGRGAGVRRATRARPDAPRNAQGRPDGRAARTAPRAAESRHGQAERGRGSRLGHSVTRWFGGGNGAATSVWPLRALWKFRNLGEHPQWAWDRLPNHGCSQLRPRPPAPLVRARPSNGWPGFLWASAVAWPGVSPCPPSHPSRCPCRVVSLSAGPKDGTRASAFTYLAEGGLTVFPPPSPWRQVGAVDPDKHYVGFTSRCCRPSCLHTTWPRSVITARPRSMATGP